MQRQQLLNKIATHINSIKLPHPIRVAIDGVDTAGKTSLADELVLPLEKLGRSVIRASIDSFHNSQIVRYQRGKHSPEGYYYDSFNYPTLTSLLLVPLGPDGNLHYQKEIFDFQNDAATKQQTYVAKENAILLFDGVFLLRPELYNYWDLKLFVKVNFETVLKRASIRDQKLFGTMDNVEKIYRQKYIPGQQIYLAACEPEKFADVVIENDDPTDVKVFWKEKS